MQCVLGSGFVGVNILLYRVLLLTAAVYSEHTVEILSIRNRVWRALQKHLHRRLSTNPMYTDRYSTVQCSAVHSLSDRCRCSRITDGNSTSEIVLVGTGVGSLVVLPGMMSLLKMWGNDNDLMTRSERVFWSGQSLHAWVEAVVNAVPEDIVVAIVSR